MPSGTIIIFLNCTNRAFPGFCQMSHRTSRADISVLYTFYTAVKNIMVPVYVSFILSSTVDGSYKNKNNNNTN